ncbi:MAG: 6-phosphogluconolactonase [Chloroflexota bacterium]
MSLIKFESKAELSEAISEMIGSLLHRAIVQRGVAHIVLSGGGTPKPVFEALAHKPLAWEKVHVWWADERLVPPNDSGSNYGMAKAALLDHVPIPLEQIHRARGELSPELAVADYAHQLAQTASSGYWPRFDVTILGMGGDGHTASLFPGRYIEEEWTTPVLHVTAEYEGRPADRVTLTPVAINASRNIIYLVTGASKGDALVAAFGERDIINWPVHRIQPYDGDVIWAVDYEAASKLA